VKELREQVGAAEKDNRDLERKVAALQKSKEDLEKGAGKEEAGIAKRMDKLKEEVKSKDAKIVDLESAVKKAKKEGLEAAKGKSGDVDAASKEVAALKKQLAGVQKEAKAAENKINAAETRAKNAEKKTTKAEEAAAAAKAAADKAKADLSKLKIDGLASTSTSGANSSRMNLKKKSGGSLGIDQVRSSRSVSPRPGARGSVDSGRLGTGSKSARRGSPPSTSARQRQGSLTTPRTKLRSKSAETRAKNVHPKQAAKLEAERSQMEADEEPEVDDLVAEAR